MLNRNIPYIWIILGIIELFFGIDGYIMYSSGGLFNIWIPEQIMVKNIAFGIISISMGIDLLFKPKRQVRNVYSISIWVLLFIMTGTIYQRVVWGNFDLEFIVLYDYWFIVLAIFTLKEFKNEGILIELNFFRYLSSNSLFIILSGLILNGSIFILADFLLYELFY